MSATGALLFSTFSWFALTLPSRFLIEASRELDERIVKGHNASIQQFPHAISLRISDNIHNCGGVLISKDTVITAAHCLDKSPLQHAVYGSDFLSNGGTIHKIAAVVIHPGWTRGKTFQNDIGIVRLKTQVKYLGSRYPKLRTSKVENNEACITVGWGREKAPWNSSTLPGYLKRATFYLKTFDTCKKSWGREFSDGMVCATASNWNDGTNTAKDGICRGDSGGGLMCKGEVTGIVSYSFKNCGTGIPDVYTEIRYFQRWIDSTLRRLKYIRFLRFIPIPFVLHTSGFLNSLDIYRENY